MPERDSWAVQAAGPAGLLDTEDTRIAIGALWTPGSSAIRAKTGFRPGPGTSPGLVTASGTPDAFVHVAPFQLVLQSSRGSALGAYIATLDAVKDINILSTPADPTNPRDDLIVAQQNDTFHGDANSTFTVRHVVGIPAGSPTDPTVTGSGDFLRLARVRVGAGVTSITGANITDLRATTGFGTGLNPTGGMFTAALGGLLPVASEAQRNALVGVYDGLPIWRTDRNWVEIHDGTAWRVQGVPVVSSVADLAAVTHPTNGQIAYNTGNGHIYRRTASAWVADRPGGIVQRAKRTTSSSTTTSATGIGVLRIDDVPIYAGRSYMVVTNAMVPASSVANDFVLMAMRHTTDGSTPTTASPLVPGALAQLPAFSTTIVTTTPLQGFYTPAADQTWSVLLCVARAAGTGSVFIFGDANFVIDYSIVDLGFDPGDTGVDL